MIYLIYSKFVFDRGMVPSTHCCAEEYPHAGMFHYMSLANYAFKLDGKRAIEIKNRYDHLGEFEMDEQEIIVLKLKSVLL